MNVLERITELLGAAAMAVVFFGVFAPVALAMALAGRDAFERT
jgi:hypothetical protein